MATTTASRIITEICNRRRNSDIRADDLEVRFELDKAFDELRAAHAETQEQLTQAQRDAERLRETVEIVRDCMDCSIEMCAQTAETFANKFGEHRGTSERIAATIRALLSKPEGAMCRCGHAEEQHEGHTYQPGSEPPTHCSADCSCLEFVAGKTPRPRPNTDVIQQPEHLSERIKGAHDAIFGGEGTTKEKE